VSHETAQNTEGKWQLFTVNGGQRGERIGDEYRTSDQALSALVDDLDRDLLFLNSPPPKPQRNKEKGAATGRNQPTEPKRRQRKAAATA
jgi:hypothetical protein